MADKDDNGKGVIWRSAIGILIAVLSFLSAFMFNKVVAIPDIYQKIQTSKEINQSQDKRQERLEQKIDDGFETLREQFREINKYLRDNPVRRTPSRNSDGG